MSLIKPKQEQKHERVRIKMDSKLLTDINCYCEYAGFKKSDEFFEEAALHILTKDKDFKEWKETNAQTVNRE